MGLQEANKNPSGKGWVRGTKTVLYHRSQGTAPGQVVFVWKETKSSGPCKLREIEDFSRKGEILEDTHIYILCLSTYLFILDFG